MSDVDAINQAVALFGSSGRVASQKSDLQVIPTGIEVLDSHVLGCGGLPRGRAIEVFAESSVGKSTFCQWLAGKVQAAGGVVCWFDTEKTFMNEYGRGSGIVVERLILPEFGHGDDLIYKMKLAIASNFYDLIVIDSMNSVLPKALSESELDQMKMNERMQIPKMWNDFCTSIQNGFYINNLQGKPLENDRPVPIIDPDKKIEVLDKKIHRLEDKKCCVLVVSHKKKKIGISYGANWYTSGGVEKDFLFSMRLDLSIKQTKTGKQAGLKVLKFRDIQVKATKNKCAPPLREGRIFMYPDGKIDVATAGTGTENNSSEDTDTDE